MNFPDRWQDCEAFIEALLKRQYVTRDEAGNVGPLMADGIYLYMYELWKDGSTRTIDALLLANQALSEVIKQLSIVDQALSAAQEHLPSAPK